MDILLENASFRLVLGPDCVAKSLVLKSTGEECLKTGEEIPLFSVTQDRPWNNEVKLAHPNKRTVYPANRVTREGDLLHVGFETVPVKADIRIREAESYIAFTLEKFTSTPEDYAFLNMKVPPVVRLRLIQLPVLEKSRFGEWLNVMWDDHSAVNVLATSPHACIDSEKRKGYRILTADAVKGIQLEGCTAALIVSETGRFLNAMETLEEDFHLPAGVKSRRSEWINASVYWTAELYPENVDEHIQRALQGGFRLMLIYYTSMFCEENGYSLNGNYDYNKHYPNGRQDVEAVLRKIRAAGIQPGIHFLQTHIGLRSRYVTPHADHRLHITDRFTLAKPLTKDDTRVYVEQNPDGIVMDEKCRYLKFGTELISYSGYNAEVPYFFTGCRRGAYDTEVIEHPQGEMGGLLDITEFGGSSCYIDQETSLQDEIAEKIADVYNAGFRFCYMDGSEGTNAPFEFHVPNAQYRVYRRFIETPLFTEGAAKAHFSWHFQSGGNAFDIFPPRIFKEKIVEFPAEEAPRMRQDFTRLDFGWWGFWAPGEKDNGTQADMYEFGTSLAAAWDCPATMQASLETFRSHPRIDDILETMRRWEDVRKKRLLTEEQKRILQDTSREHTLLIDEEGEYELAEWTKIAAPKDLSAFLIERKDRRVVVYWHERGSGKLTIGSLEDVCVTDRLGGEPLPVRKNGEKLEIPAENKRYLVTSSAAQAVRDAFAGAELG